MSDDLVKRLWKGIADLDAQQDAADRIEALTAKLAEVEAKHIRYLRTMEAKLFLTEERAEAAEAERDALLESGLAAYFAGSGDAKARERDAYKRGHRAALKKAAETVETEAMHWAGLREGVLFDRQVNAIRAIPDSEGDET